MIFRFRVQAAADSELEATAPLAINSELVACVNFFCSFSLELDGSSNCRCHGWSQERKV